MWVIEMLAGLLFFTLVLLVYALIYNAPLIVLLVLARRRLGTLAPRLLLAAGFLASTTYMIYRMEWFDVWRHGFPGVAYLLRTHGFYGAVLAGFGWLLGSMIFGEAKSPAAVAAGLQNE